MPNGRKRESCLVSVLPALPMAGRGSGWRCRSRVEWELDGEQGRMDMAVAAVQEQPPATVETHDRDTVPALDIADPDMTPGRTIGAGRLADGAP